MILVTVGMQLGFDRLVRAMDSIAPQLGVPIIAQTGKGSYEPVAMEARAQLDPEAFEKLVEEVSLLVSHAGIGTVLTAARAGKPILLFPRRADLREHRNDHQMATARSLAGRPGIFVAQEEAELLPKIEEALATKGQSIARSASVHGLHKALSGFIENGRL